MGTSRRMKRARSWGILLSTIAFLANALLASTSAASGAPAWSITPIPMPAGATSAELRAVACLSATNCFAAGSQRIPPGGGNRQLLERWNGSSWKVMAEPAGSPGSRVLDITCPSAGNCFAVGTRNKRSGGRNYVGTFAEHWNGSSWTIMATPDLEMSGYLEGVACATKTSCFAVGRPSIEHWNGHRWSLVAVPKSITGLTAITCPATESCFAVGDRGTSNNGARALIEHWNGRGWSAMTTPAPRDLIEGLADIACQSAVSCFAVGSYSDMRDGSAYPMIYRWDGSHWSRMTPAATPRDNNESPLDGIACPSANRCVAVGSTGIYFPEGGKPDTWKTMVQEWDGSSWSLVSSPSPSGARISVLFGVACPNAATCLAAGISSSGPGPLAERYA